MLNPHKNGKNQKGSGLRIKISLNPPEPFSNQYIIEVSASLSGGPAQKEEAERRKANTMPEIIKRVPSYRIIFCSYFYLLTVSESSVNYD